MKKVIVFIALIIMLVVVFSANISLASELKKVETERDLFFNTKNAAEAVINQVEQNDSDYFYDVLIEGDTYQNWLHLNEY